ncbi:hypothetical protein GF312_01325 [Candidatus Poribacteria bacterium]|nr:hypothetical protein [Candidatus Poribacteria bacterium]
MLRRILTLLAVYTCISFNLNIQAAIVTDGLIGYWTFDKADIEGKMIKDSVGDNDGLINGAELAVGQVADALKFDGEDDFVSLDNGGGTVNDLINGLSAVTFTAWVNPEEISTTEYYNDIIT